MVGKLVNELVGNKIVCVPMLLVTEFLIECGRCNIIANGGAFTDSLDSQYFYI